MKRLLFIILFLLSAVNAFADCSNTYDGASRFGCVFQTSTSQSVGFGALAISGQTGWTYYNGGDSPRGGYLTNAVVASRTATVTLPASLTSGTAYKIWVKAIDYDNANTFTVTVGGTTSASVSFNDRDTNRYWAVASVTPASTSSTLVLTITRVGTNLQNLFIGLYVTTNVNQTMTSQDLAVDLTAPTERVNLAVGGNYVANGSFEAGLDGQFGIGTQSIVQFSSTWDCSGAAAHSGTCGLAVPVDAAAKATGSVSQTDVLSRVYHLKPNRQYSASVWVKASTGSTFCALFFQNAFNTPGTTDPIYYFGSSVAVSTSWAQISGTGYALVEPSSDLQFKVQCNDIATTGSKLYFDDFSLREGTVTTYADANPMDCVVATGKPGNIFYTTDSLSGSVRCHNTTGASISKPLYYTIYDSELKIVANSSQTVTAGAGASTTTTFPLATGETGPFTLVTWFSGENNTQRELTYSIVPNYATTSGLDPTSMMCLHPTSISWQLTEWQRLGFKWFRALSPTGIFIQQAAEPTEGNFVYFDSVVSNAAAAGLKVIGVFYCTNGLCSSYMNNAGVPDLTKWSTYVTTLVNHYKALPTPVTVWEVWNEPAFTASFYTQLLKTTVDAIKAAQPTAQIVGIGGKPASYIADVITEIGVQYPMWDWQSDIAFLAGHEYPGGQPPETYTSIINSYTPGGWNTESGGFDYGSLWGLNSSWTGPGYPVFGPYQDAARFYNGIQANTNNIINVAARTRAAKQTNYCYYDGRTVGIPDKLVGATQSTTTLEYDETIGAKGLGLTMLASYIDHATNYGNVSPNSNTYALLFEQPSTVGVAVLWSSDNAFRQITLTGSHSDYQFFDRFGNAVDFTGTVFTYGRTPRYILTNGISRATLGTRLAAGVIASATDTVAPNVVVAEGPRAWAETLNNPRFRWLGADNQWLPTDGEGNQEGGNGDPPNPDALLYCWKLDSVDGDYTSPCTENTYVEYTDVPNSTTVFHVKVVDGSGNFSIVDWPINGVTDSLAFTIQPSSITSASSFLPAVVVSVLLPGGAVDTGASGTVSLVVNGCGTTLLGTSSRAAVSGVATFTGLGATGAATGCVLTASYSGLSDVTSASFNVNGLTAPTLVSISPNSGLRGNIIPVVLTGTGFDAGNAAVFASGTGISITDVTVISSVNITANFAIASDAGIGARNINVTTVNGTSNNITFTVTSLSPDTKVPVPGYSGKMFNRGATISTITSGWYRAQDDVTPQAQLQYQVYMSTVNNISTVATAEANGIIVQTYTSDIVEATATGLGNGQWYYFNVIVKDAAGNKAAYRSIRIATKKR